MDVGWVGIYRTNKIQKIKFTCLGGIFILTEIVVRFRNASSGVDVDLTTLIDVDVGLIYLDVLYITDA